MAVAVLAALSLSSCVVCCVLALVILVMHPEWLPLGPGALPANFSQADFVGGSLDTRATGRMPPIVSYQGKQAYQFTYQAGKIHGEGVNGSITLRPPALPATQARVRFRVWFADNFPWDGANNQPVGGKLGGFMIGTGEASGGNYSPTGASFRVVFKKDGELDGYLYPAVRRPYQGRSISWEALDQSDEVRAVGSIATGVHLWRGGPLKVYKGRWNTIDMFCRLNTPGAKDGILALAVNGVTRQLSTVRYRYDSARIERFELGTFFGGGDQSYAPRVTTSAWFSDFLFTRA